MYLFLDIDGVLNTQESYGLWKKRNDSPVPEICFETRAVDNLNRLLSFFPGEIVISSSWKKTMGIETLREVFRANGVRTSPASVTPNGESKGSEILEWLDKNREKSNFSYLVLDDQTHEIEDRIPEANFLHIYNGWTGGFSEVHLREAIIRISHLSEISRSRNIQGYQSVAPAHSERLHL